MSPNNPLNGNGLIQLTRVSNSIQLQWVKILQKGKNCPSILLYLHDLMLTTGSTFFQPSRDAFGLKCMLHVYSAKVKDITTKQPPI